MASNLEVLTLPAPENEGANASDTAMRSAESRKATVKRYMIIFIFDVVDSMISVVI